MTDDSGLAPLGCPRCGRAADPYDLTFYRGCVDCARAGVPVNYVCQTPAERITAALRADPPTRGPGLWRWAGALPMDPAHGVSIGEGDSPLVPLPRLGAEYGLAGLYVKNESTNPTWSHKDRLSALAVAAARAVGATTITAASTGNHGAALAAYAARAGLRCVIFTLASVPETMKTLMLSYGAEVVAVAEGEHRYVLMAEGVDRHGWYPGSNGVSPPVGSTPYGIDGYKTIAYELFQQLGGQVPDVMVLPVTYGDCLSGVHRGFVDLHAAGLAERVPRLVGAEVFGALEQGLADAEGAGHGVRPPRPVPTRPTAAFSIFTAYATYQAVHAVRHSGGRTVTIGEADMLATQYRLASTEGLFAEASSAVGVAAAGVLARSGYLRPQETVVCLLTSTALKDPAAGRALLPEVPVVDPSVVPPADVVAALRGAAAGTR